MLRRAWGRDVNIIRDKEDVMGFVRRRARRRTALLVGGAAATAGYAAGRSRGGGEEDSGGGGGHEEQPPPQAAPAPASPTIDYDELKRLGELHADGTLTDEEFAAAKAKVLGT